MKKVLSLSTVPILCLLLTSCVVTSDNPLSAPEKAKPDPALVGQWQNKDDPSETYVFSIKDEHWMHIEDRKKDHPPESYDFFTTKVGENTFLNVIHLGKDDQGQPTHEGYFIVRYRVSADHVLTTFYIDQD